MGSKATEPTSGGSSRNMKSARVGASASAASAQAESRSRVGVEVEVDAAEAEAELVRRSNNVYGAESRRRQAQRVFSGEVARAAKKTKSSHGQVEFVTREATAKTIDKDSDDDEA